MQTTVGALLLVVALATHPSSNEPAREQIAQGTPLTLTQVKDLVGISAPDVVIADELKARGTAFRIDEATLAELRLLGAGPKTLSALQELQPKGNVASEAPVRVGGNISPPTRIKDVQPVYPIEARSARAQGIVILDLVLNADGTVRDVHVLRSIPSLDMAAVETAKQWVYSPTSLNGVRVPVILTATVQFTLESAPVETSAVGLEAPGSIPVEPKKPASTANTDSAPAAVNGQRYPMIFPVVHAHKWGRCWGTLVISKTSLKYEQSGGGKDSFDVPMAQVTSVGSWSPAYLEIALADGRKLHFAHGEMRDPPGSGFTIADLVNLSPKEPVIAAIRGAK